MLKIAYIIDNLGVGGAQTMVVRLVSNMDKKKHAVKVFVLREREYNELEKELVDNGIDIEFLDIKNDITLTRKIRAYLSLSKALSRFKPHILHVHLDFIYSLFYCAFHKSKLVVTIHGWPERVINKRFKFIVSSFMLRRKTVVIGCAEAVADCTKKILPKLRVLHIYNPINLSEYRYCSKNSEQNECPFVYIHVGRFTEIKNQKMILDAFSDLLEDHPTSKLRMVGDGELSDVLKNEATKLGIINSVSFMGQRYDIPYLLSISDVFLISSVSECCPMSVIEAMASGLPIIATNVGGIKEIVKDAGICVDSKDVKSFQNAMSQLQEDTALRKQLSKNALRNAKLFDASVIARDYEKIYKELIDG